MTSASREGDRAAPVAFERDAIWMRPPVIDLSCGQTLTASGDRLSKRLVREAAIAVSYELLNFVCNSGHSQSRRDRPPSLGHSPTR
ncbi:MAG: hypothetical protein ACFB0G_09135 [Leptolyngbyaceae cyanobacterium]